MIEFKLSYLVGNARLLLRMTDMPGKTDVNLTALQSHYEIMCADKFLQ